MAAFANEDEYQRALSGEARETHNRHRRYYDRRDAIDSNRGRGTFMREVTSWNRNEQPHRIMDMGRFGSVQRFYQRNPESQNITTRRAREAGERARESWGVVRGTVHGAAAMRDAGRRRESGRAPAGWSNPIGMVREAMGAPRAVSPRSMQARQTAQRESQRRRNLRTGTQGERSRAEQDGRTMSRSGRRRAAKRERQRQSLRDDIERLSDELNRRRGFYFGSMQDQEYQRLVERAMDELGDEAPEEQVHDLADRYYNIRYYPGRFSREERRRRDRGSGERSERGLARTSASSSSSSNGPAPLNVPDEILDRDDHPSYFLCPITMEFMTDPVVLSSGQTYQRNAITEHLRRNNKDPLSNAPLKNKSMTPNMALRHAMTAYLARIAREGSSGSSSSRGSPRASGSSSSASASSQASRRQQRASAAERRKQSGKKGKGKKRGGRKTRKKRGGHHELLLLGATAAAGLYDKYKKKSKKKRKTKRRNKKKSKKSRKKRR